MIATTTLQKVDADRLQRGVEGLARGAYSITITRQNEQKIRAYVTSGDGKACSVALTEERSFCGCGDSMFRGKTCKHATALALFVIRNPKMEQKPETSTDYMIHMMSHNEEPRPLPKLARVRRTA